jgi:hypothetical protein
MFDILRILSEDEAQKVKLIGGDPTRGLDLTFDNVQTFTKQWEPRIGRENTMKVGMAGTVVTGGKGSNTQWVHAEYIVITVNK